MGFYELCTAAVAVILQKTDDEKIERTGIGPPGKEAAQITLICL